MSIISTNPVPSSFHILRKQLIQRHGKDERGRGQGKGEEEDIGGK